MRVCKVWSFPIPDTSFSVFVVKGEQVPLATWNKTKVLILYCSPGATELTIRKKRDSFFLCARKPHVIIFSPFYSIQNCWKKVREIQTCIISFSLMKIVGKKKEWGHLNSRIDVKSSYLLLLTLSSHFPFTGTLWTWRINTFIFLLLNVVFFLNMVATHPKIGHKREVLTRYVTVPR